MATYSLNSDEHFLRCFTSDKIIVNEYIEVLSITPTIAESPWNCIATIGSNSPYQALKVRGTVIKGVQLKTLMEDLSSLRMAVNREGLCVLDIGYRMFDLFDWSKYGVHTFIRTVWTRQNIEAGRAFLGFSSSDESDDGRMGDIEKEGSMRELVSGMKEELGEMVGKLRGVKDKYQKTKSDLEETKDELEETKEELEDTKEELEEMTEELEEKKVELKDMQSELDETKSVLEQMEHDFDETTSELKKTKNELKETKIELEGLKSDFDGTNSELEVTKKELRLRENEKAATKQVVSFDSNKQSTEQYYSELVQLWQKSYPSNKIKVKCIKRHKANGPATDGAIFALTPLSMVKSVSSLPDIFLRTDSSFTIDLDNWYVLNVTSLYKLSGDDSPWTTVCKTIVYYDGDYSYIDAFGGYQNVPVPFEPEHITDIFFADLNHIHGVGCRLVLPSIVSDEDYS